MTAFPSNSLQSVSCDLLGYYTTVFGSKYPSSLEDRMRVVHHSPHRGHRKGAWDTQSMQGKEWTPEQLGDPAGLSGRGKQEWTDVHPPHFKGTPLQTPHRALGCLLGNRHHFLVGQPQLEQSKHCLTLALPWVTYRSPEGNGDKTNYIPHGNSFLLKNSKDGHKRRLRYPSVTPR